jgi:hypothetical protein
MPVVVEVAPGRRAAVGDGRAVGDVAEGPVAVVDPQAPVEDVQPAVVVAVGEGHRARAREPAPPLVEGAGVIGEPGLSGLHDSETFHVEPHHQVALTGEFSAAGEDHRLEAAAVAPAVREDGDVGRVALVLGSLGLQEGIDAEPVVRGEQGLPWRTVVTGPDVQQLRPAQLQGLLQVEAAPAAVVVGAESRGPLREGLIPEEVEEVVSVVGVQGQVGRGVGLLDPEAGFYGDDPQRRRRAEALDLEDGLVVPGHRRPCGFAQVVAQDLVDRLGGWRGRGLGGGRGAGAGHLQEPGGECERAERCTHLIPFEAPRRPLRIGPAHLGERRPPRRA